MKTIATAIVAVLAACATASATDLPSKAKAPVATKVSAPRTADTTLSIGYGPEYATGGLLSDKSRDGYGIGLTHRFGQYHLGAALGITDDRGTNRSKADFEALAGYTQPISDGMSANASVGIGQRFQESGDLPYFALYGGTDYRLNSTVTLNAIGYRYRDSFGNGRDFQSHQLGTGITVAVADGTSVAARVYRQYDSAWQGTADGIGMGVNFSF